MRSFGLVTPCIELIQFYRPSNDDHAIFPDRHEDVTFVNRPFPLDEAPEHFARLRRWGLTFSAQHDCLLRVMS